MSQSNFQFWTNNNFIRPTTDQIKFMFVRSKLDYHRSNKRGNRRGVYYFESKVDYFDEEDNFLSIQAQFTFQPHKKELFLINSIQPLNDKSPNQSIDHYLLQDKDGDSCLIYNQNVIREKEMNEIKNTIIRSIMNSQYWVFHKTYPYYYVGGIGKTTLILLGIS